jgi:ketosteroid isomerase-like protein
MKRLLAPAILLSPILLFTFGCPVEEKIRTIEQAVADFEKAVNSDNVKELQDVLSPESDFFITKTFQAFLDYFDGQTDVSYTNLVITVNGDTADVTPTATYNNGLSDVTVLFVMKKESSDPDNWKVLQYYDDADGTFDFIWKKLQIQTR